MLYVKVLSFTRVWFVQHRALCAFAGTTPTRSVERSSHPSRNSLLC
jgi:hypothetical protein